MSDVVLLRKLARKSIMKFGKHHDLSVQELLNLTKGKYLRWVYFNCSNIDFMEDILDEIKIPQEFRIKKPSKNIEFHEKVNQYIFDNLDVRFIPKYLANKNKIATLNTKSKLVNNKIKDTLNYNKSAMQRLNHGH